MDLDSLVALAQSNGASDLHLEPGLPAALRIRGGLRTMGEPIPASTLLEFAQQAIGPEQWPHFVERRSHDFSKTIHGVRCRINVLQSSRGVGFAVRMLTSFQATIDKLNLHPDLKKFVAPTTGLVLVSGPTGSGKSSTLAALLEEINLTEPRHIITIESPIEYTFRLRKSYIRQREVGRDTPSFEQALLDSLREDPDVLMVGEMRDPETMRLTLSAAETGHLVLATVHSSTCAEALQRVVGAFPSEIQSGIAAQLADAIVGVVSQRLRFRPELNIRVPECEILLASNAVKNFIRTREFFRIISAIETGGEHGMWTFNRYRNWLDGRRSWSRLDQEPETIEADAAPAAVPSMTTETTLLKNPWGPQRKATGPSTPTHEPAPKPGRIEITPESEFGKILKPPEKK